MVKDAPGTDAADIKGAGTAPGSIVEGLHPNSYMKYENVKTMGALTSRRHIKITPKYGGQFKPGDLLRMEVPTVDKLDPESVNFTFDLIIQVGTNSVQVQLKSLSNSLTGTVPDNNYNFNNTIGTADSGSNNNLGSFARELYVFDKTINATSPPLAPYVQTTLAGAADNAGTDAGAGASEGAANQYWCALLANKYLFNPTGTGTYLIPANGVQKMFDRIRLVQGSIVAEDILRYNYLYALLIKATANTEWRNTVGMLTEGLRDEMSWYHILAAAVHSSYGTGTNPISRTAVGKRYCIRPLLGLLNCGKLWPTDLMGQFTFEFYFTDPKNFLISSNLRVGPTGANNIYQKAYTSIAANNVSTNFETCFPNATYYIQNVRLHCDFVTPIESYNMKLLDMVQSKGIEIHYDTYTCHERQSSTFRGQQHFNFQERSVSIKGGYAVMVTQDDINDIRSEMASFKNLGMELYQWKIGSEYIPAQTVDLDQANLGFGGVEAYMEKLRGFNQQNNLLATGLDNIFTWTNTSPQYNNISSNNAAANYGFYVEDTPEAVYRDLKHGKASSFMLALQLEKVVGQLSGFNSLAANVDIELSMRLNQNGVAQDYASYYYVMPCNPKTQNSNRVNLISGASRLGDPFGQYGELIQKDAPSYFNIFFFAHVDALLVLKDVGSIEIRR